jgi:hypothetical protein
MEAAVWAMVVAVVLPFFEFVVEDLGVVDDQAVEEGVELFSVDAVGSLHFPVQSWGSGFDVAMGDPFVQYVVPPTATQR